MASSDEQSANPSPEPGIPRGLALVLAVFVCFAVIPLVHAVLPWAISLLGPRYGWAAGRPALWNILGLVPVAGGTVVLVWLMVLGFAHWADLPKRVVLDWSPKILMMRGPYTFSRHPMYVAELALWLGWAVLFGSLGVGLGLLLLIAVVCVLAPREERALEAKFGDAYRRYKARVPRWLGRRPAHRDDSGSVRI